MNEDKYTENQLKDHEIRIRKLEENDIQQRIQLTNIEKSQGEIKLMMAEQSKEQMKQNKEQIKALNDVTGDMIKYFQNQTVKNSENENKIKFQDRKEFWALVSLIAGALITWLGLK
jgi:hypothetical protein